MTDERSMDSDEFAVLSRRFDELAQEMGSIRRRLDVVRSFGDSNEGLSTKIRDDIDRGGDQSEVDTTVSRRHALRTAGVVAVGALAGGIAVVATASPAAAAPGTFDGNPAVSATANPGTGVGVSASASGLNGTAVNASSLGTNGVALRGVGNSVNGTGVQATGGYAGVDAISVDGVGVQAHSTNFIGVSGIGRIGLSAYSDTITLRLNPVAATPPGSSNTYLAGDVVVDVGDVAWYCIAGGTPGTWRRLSAPGTAGSFTALTPGRVYDSRVPSPAPGILGVGGAANRTVSVADQRNLTTGVVVTSDFVPTGATAVFANVTITDTVNSGYLTVNPGGTLTASASTINWSATGQTLANGVVLVLDASRQVTIVAGGPGATNVIVDVMGYYR